MKIKNPLTRERKTIGMSVSDDADFLSKYSEIGKPVISEEVADFLENAARAFHPDQSFTLDIKSDCIDEAEKPRYQEAIKNHYDLKLSEIERELKRKTFISVFFTAIGVIALAVMFILSALHVGEIWTECVDIFAWVFLWEAVDQFFIERSGLLMKSKRYKNFTEMQVNFI